MVFKIISNIVVSWLIKESPPSEFPLCDFERIKYEVRPCDALLIEGRSRVSDVIRVITQSSWSHSALYIGKLHDISDPALRELARKHFNGPSDTQLVIEGMMGKGTIISPLSDYKNDHIRICRPHGLSLSDSQSIIGFALNRLGTDYDIWHIVELMRFFFPWSIFPIKLRSKLFARTAGKSTKTVCSTMMAEAFSAVDFPILPYIKRNKDQSIEFIQRNPRLFVPRDFDYSPYFDIIKYPYVDLDNSASYRKLPWNREGLLSHDNEYITSDKSKAKSKKDDINGADLY